MFNRIIPPTSRSLLVPRLGTSQQRPFRYTSTVSGNDPKTLAEEKERNLKKKQQHTSTPHENAPGWNEYLATTSEAHIKADKSSQSNSPQDLQEKTVAHIKKRYTQKTESQWNPFTEIELEATYEKEEVEGPLGQKPTKTHEFTYESDEVRGPLGQKTKG